MKWPREIQARYGRDIWELYRRYRRRPRRWSGLYLPILPIYLPISPHISPISPLYLPYISPISRASSSEAARLRISFSEVRSPLLAFG